MNSAATIVDHIALPSHNIAGDAAWYVRRMGAKVLYQDATWAFLEFANVKLALVTPSQHPPHVAIRVDGAELAEAAVQAAKPIDRHRDGTQGIYLTDPSGNAVELICYPAGETTYG